MNSENRPRRVCVRIGDEIRWITKNGAHIPIDTDTGDVAQKYLYNEDRFQKLIGQEHTGVKGQAAVRKLLEERHGHVKGAFHREDIGDIDLIWGDDQVGLCHILKRRGEQGIDSGEFARNLSRIIHDGDLCQTAEKYEIWHEKKMVVVTKAFHGKEATFILTAFPSRKKPARFNKQA